MSVYNFKSVGIIPCFDIRIFISSKILSFSIYLFHGISNLFISFRSYLGLFHFIFISYLFISFRFVVKVVIESVPRCLCEQSILATMVVFKKTVVLFLQRTRTESRHVTNRRPLIMPLPWQPSVPSSWGEEQLGYLAKHPLERW